jgi:hypothetical protein
MKQIFQYFFLLLQTLNAITRCEMGTMCKMKVGGGHSPNPPSQQEMKIEISKSRVLVLELRCGLFYMPRWK